MDILDSLSVDAELETFVAMRNHRFRRFERLQSIAFQISNTLPSKSEKNVHQLKRIALSTFRNGARSHFLVRCLNGCTRDLLLRIVEALGLSDRDTATNLELDNDVLIELLRSFINGYSWNREASEISALAHRQDDGKEEGLFFSPPHPVSGQHIWDTHIVPRGSVGSPAVPRMQAAYRSFRGYICESLHLQRLNLTACMRAEIESALNTSSAVHLEEVSSVSLRQPAVGSKLPRQIFVDVIVSLTNMDAHGQANWDLHSRKGDTVVLLEVSPSNETTMATTPKQVTEVKSSLDNRVEAEFDALVGRVQQARLATVVDILDDQGTSVFRRKRNTNLIGSRRTLRVSLSPVQYIHDVQRGKEFITSTLGSLNSILYGSLRLSAAYSLVRGLSKLLRSHMNSSGNNGLFKFPSWLGSALLGTNCSNSIPDNESGSAAVFSSKAPESVGTFDAFNLFETRHTWRRS